MPRKTRRTRAPRQLIDEAILRAQVSEGTKGKTLTGSPRSTTRALVDEALYPPHPFVPVP